MNCLVVGLESSCKASLRGEACRRQETASPTLEELGSFLATFLSQPPAPLRLGSWRAGERVVFLLILYFLLIVEIRALFAAMLPE